MLTLNSLSSNKSIIRRRLIFNYFYLSVSKIGFNLSAYMQRNGHDYDEGLRGEEKSNNADAGAAAIVECNSLVVECLFEERQQLHNRHVTPPPPPPQSPDETASLLNHPESGECRRERVDVLLCDHSEDFHGISGSTRSSNGFENSPLPTSGRESVDGMNEGRIGTDNAKFLAFLGTVNRQVVKDEDEVDDENAEHGGSRKIDEDDDDEMERKESHHDKASVDEKVDFASKLITEEERSVHSLKWSVYSCYLKAGGLLFLICFFLAAITSQAFSLLSSFWLSAWGSRCELSQNENIKYVIIFAIISGFGIVFQVVKAVFLANFRLRASKNLHDRLLNTVLDAPGRIEFYNYPQPFVLKAHTRFLFNLHYIPTLTYSEIL